MSTESFGTVSGKITNEENKPISLIQVMLVGNNNVISSNSNESGLYLYEKVLLKTGYPKRYTIMPVKYEPMNIIDNSQVDGAEIVRIAEKEIGNGPDLKYHTHGKPWCSEFVSWVYNEARDPFKGGTSDGGSSREDWVMSTVDRILAGFGRNANWQVLSVKQINQGWDFAKTNFSQNPLEPQPGDYVFFSNTTGIGRSHSGMVKEIKGNDMITIEGNISDKVAERTRSNWRTKLTGNTIIKGIGYRRLVSNVIFEPKFESFRDDNQQGYWETNFKLSYHGPSFEPSTVSPPDIRKIIIN